MTMSRGELEMLDSVLNPINLAHAIAVTFGGDLLFPDGSVPEWEDLMPWMDRLAKELRPSVPVEEE